MEYWKEIPGYEGLYEVSNKGNVRNVRRNTLLRLPKTNKGYIQVGWCKNGIRNGLKVHRIVAQAFLPNPDNLPQVNHKDEDKTNNNVDNLEWCDTKYNNNYGSRNIRIRDTLIKNGPCSGLSEKEREEYMKEYRKEYRKKNREKIREKQREYLREYRKKRKINKM